MAPYVPRPPLVINCLDDKPWFPIGTRGRGYCVIALSLCRARHIVNTPSPQTLRCTVDKFSKTDKHQLGHTCNVLITSVQVFLGIVSLVYLHDDGFSYMCNLEPSIVFLFARKSNFKLMLISVGHIYPRKGASVILFIFPLCSQPSSLQQSSA